MFKERVDERIESIINTKERRKKIRGIINTTNLGMIPLDDTAYACLLTMRAKTDISMARLAKILLEEGIRLMKWDKE